MNSLVLTFLIVGAVFCSTQILASTESLSSLTTWKEANQKVDDAQDVQIHSIESEIASHAKQNGERLVVLETKMTYVQASLGSLSTRVWALLTGILALLLNATWSAVKTKHFKK